MSNRRFGGGMGPQRGRNMPQQHYQSNNVSPWQAPNNNPMNQGLLGQLSTPQQLALALTSLLQPQQQQQQQNPPSLLSLNTAPYGRDGYDNQNRFGNRGRADFKRLDSFKNRGPNWRNDVNRPRQGGNFNRNNQQRNRDNKKFDNKNKQNEKSEDKNKDDAKKEADMSVDESRDEDSKEKKRDWKEEKNTSDDKEDRRESIDLTEDDKKTDKDDPSKREGRYTGVPPSLLHCFVCNKSMWDGESFQNHIRGKAHKQMLQSLEESFQITVNILRENMRLVEEQKMIEFSRMSRNNRNFQRKQQEPQSTCNMCDLKFLGKIIVHRKTEGHQRLKRFLHPNCNVCKQEFPARMEWVEHRFSPEHLRKLKEVMDSKVGGADGAIIEEELTLDLEPLLEEPLQVENEKPVLELSDDMANFQNRIPAYKKTRAVATENLKPSSGFLCDLCDRFFPGEDVAQAHLKTQRHYFAFLEAAKRKNKRVATEKAEEEKEAKRRKLDESTEEGKEGEKDGEAQNETAVNGDGNEMYDPEEACDEKEESEEAKGAEEVKKEVVDVDEQGEEQEDSLLVEVKSEKFEEEAKPSVNSPRGRRAAGVKNGTAPKSKRGRK